MTDTMQDPPAASTPEGAFLKYFAANYPAGSTIHNPTWHAVKIFRAAQAALAAPRSPERATGGDATADFGEAVDVARFSDTTDEALADALLAARAYTATAFHWALNVAAARLRPAVAAPSGDTPVPLTELFRMERDRDEWKGEANRLFRLLTPDQQATDFSLTPRVESLHDQITSLTAQLEEARRGRDEEYRMWQERAKARVERAVVEMRVLAGEKQQEMHRMLDKLVEAERRADESEAWSIEARRCLAASEARERELGELVKECSRCRGNARLKESERQIREHRAKVAASPSPAPTRDDCSPSGAWLHHRDCDSVLSDSDIVAGITSKPCNCNVGRSPAPTPDRMQPCVCGHVKASHDGSCDHTRRTCAEVGCAGPGSCEGGDGQPGGPCPCREFRAAPTPETKPDPERDRIVKKYSDSVIGYAEMQAQLANLARRRAAPSPEPTAEGKP